MLYLASYSSSVEIMDIFACLRLYINLVHIFLSLIGFFIPHLFNCFEALLTVKKPYDLLHPTKGTFQFNVGKKFAKVGHRKFIHTLSFRPLLKLKQNIKI